MPPERFNVGDVVQLKSGGPRMTVTSELGEEVLCVWFAGTTQTHGTFPHATLLRAPSESESGSVRR
jgi:uncharacterized protein YodC (DUF2158 family)